MDIFGYPWYPWISIDIHDTMNIHGYQWISMDLMNSTDINWFAWISIKFPFQGPLPPHCIIEMTKFHLDSSSWAGGCLSNFIPSTVPIPDAGNGDWLSWWPVSCLCHLLSLEISDRRKQIQTLFPKGPKPGGGGLRGKQCLGHSNIPVCMTIHVSAIQWTFRKCQSNVLLQLLGLWREKEHAKLYDRCIIILSY